MAGTIIPGLDRSPSCTLFSSLSRVPTGGGALVLFEAGAEPEVALSVRVLGTKPWAGRHPRLTLGGRAGAGDGWARGCWREASLM